MSRKIRNFDYVGFVLFAASLASTLIGISWVCNIGYGRAWSTNLRSGRRRIFLGKLADTDTRRSGTRWIGSFYATLTFDIGATYQRQCVSQCHWMLYLCCDLFTRNSCGF